jgi:hypothetical protein
LDSSKAHTNCRTEGYSSYEPTATAKQDDIRIPDSSVNLAEKEKINEPDERIRKVYDIIDFELSVSFEELRYYMESIFKKNKGTGDVWIHGTLNIRTGKVISVLLGCLD